MEEMYATLDDVVRFVPHRICRSDDDMYHQNGIHLNENLGTPQMLKDFYRVSQIGCPLLHERNQLQDMYLKKAWYLKTNIDTNSSTDFEKLH